MSSKFSRRNFLGLSVGTMGAALLAACAPKAEPTPKPAAPAAPAAKAEPTKAPVEKSQHPLLGCQQP
mgnify:CR=1 FL=1